MKALSFQQPWGSLICSGLKHVENRTWALSTLPVRILIHVGVKKVSGYNKDDYMPEQCLSLMRNARVMGYLPETEDLPYGAIIGWADVARCVEAGKNDSEIWADKDSIGWVLENVHILDNPIENVKGKLGLFDYPLDEGNLPPSHAAVFSDLESRGEEVVLPVNDKLWENIINGKEKIIVYDLTNDNVDLLMGEDGAVKPFKLINITNKGRSATYKLTEDTYIDTYLDEKEEPYFFTNLDGEECQWVFVQFGIGERVK